MKRLSTVAIRITALALAGGLALAGCSSEVYENQPGGMSLVLQHG